MKRLVVFLLTAVLAFSLAGCRGKENAQPDDSAPSEEIQVQDETGETTETEPEGVESNILIAYFSLGRNAEYPDNIDASTSASPVLDGEEMAGTTEIAIQICW